jgi:hemoglobin
MSVSLFEYVGGDEFFTELVAVFYDEVANDPVLRPMYPDDDMDGAERRLRMFLCQYFGGPTTYSHERGHPRLRMRHQPFPIGPDARDRWLRAMTAALDHMAPPDPARAMMDEYFAMTAEAMRQRDDDPVQSEPEDTAD